MNPVALFTISYHLGSSSRIFKTSFTGHCRQEHIRELAGAGAPGTSLRLEIIILTQETQKQILVTAMPLDCMDGNIAEIGDIWVLNSLIKVKKTVSRHIQKSQSILGSSKREIYPTDVRPMPPNMFH
ncbi:uncharacterized protein [Bos taurus]|uniref:uncharacterized protein isoform X2 n=1 Tax=Bos taurus TaxID=9913 RepID=UPI000D531C28|nr:uncharacterized protein LOC112442978 isoform X2 [Bos taurus]